MHIVLSDNVPRFLTNEALVTIVPSKEIQHSENSFTRCFEVNTSNSMHLQCGVPQNHVLGPRLYCIFAKPISEICRRHNFSHHSYADDTQVYLVIKPLDNWTNIIHARAAQGRFRLPGKTVHWGITYTTTHRNNNVNGR
jgi:hypothetical protein